MRKLLRRKARKSCSTPGSTASSGKIHRARWNTSIEHLNLIADRFRIHFDPVLRHHVVGDGIATGTIAVKGDGPVFLRPHILYMKDTCAISVKSPAIALVQDGSDIVMAAAKYGKGTAFAVVDPWLYNEYTDGHKLPQKYDNLAGGKELVRWLLQQIPGCMGRQAGFYLAVQPPSIRMSVPVMKPADSEQR